MQELLGSPVHETLRSRKRAQCWASTGLFVGLIEDELNEGGPGSRLTENKMVLS